MPPPGRGLQAVRWGVNRQVVSNPRDPLCIKLAQPAQINTQPQPARRVLPTLRVGIYPPPACAPCRPTHRIHHPTHPRAAVWRQTSPRLAGGAARRQRGRPASGPWCPPSRRTRGASRCSGHARRAALGATEGGGGGGGGGSSEGGGGGGRRQNLCRGGGSAAPSSRCGCRCTAALQRHADPSALHRSAIPLPGCTTPPAYRSSSCVPQLHRSPYILMTTSFMVSYTPKLRPT